MTALPRDISYCYGQKCKKKKECERWLGNLNVPSEGAWLSIAAFNFEEEQGICFIPVLKEKKKAA